MTDAWQPIASAPNEGLVLGWVPCAKRGNRCEIVKLRDGKPFMVGSEFHFDRAPVTHWKPLPAAPHQEEAGE